MADCTADEPRFLRVGGGISRHAQRPPLVSCAGPFIRSEGSRVGAKLSGSVAGFSLTHHNLVL
jgi:hypothetical protein